MSLIEEFEKPFHNKTSPKNKYMFSLFAQKIMQKELTYRILY